MLPPYDEEFREIAMDAEQAHAYRDLATRLTAELKEALRKRDTTLLGVVLNVLLAWSDCCFRAETVRHPRTRQVLAFTPAQFNELEIMPKERELIDICREEKAAGRKTLVYSVYTGTRDTTSRLQGLLEQEGFKVAVLRASVDASRREDWIAEQLDRGSMFSSPTPNSSRRGWICWSSPRLCSCSRGGTSTHCSRPPAVRGASARSCTCG